MELTATGHSHKVDFIQPNISTHEKDTAQTFTMAQTYSPDLRELLDRRRSFSSASLFSQVRYR
jgi:hypothetical protein